MELSTPERRTPVVLRALALLVVPSVSLVALAQRPGGPPGGGGWALAYNTHGGAVAFGGSSTRWDDRILTDASGWYASPNSVGGYDHPGGNPPGSVSITSAGSPGIRLSWTGSGDPPKETWLLVTSTASWSASEGSGSASDGLGDQEKSDTSRQEKNGTSTGMRVFRLTGGATREKIISISAQATASSSKQVYVATASANIVGSLANKSASLARSDGGGFNAQSKDDTLVADTLLSWNDADGVELGPNAESLTGTYAGTWNKLSDGVTDNVIINWSGASPAGGSTLGPIPEQDHHTTTYPASAAGGKMPQADGTGAKKTQDWTYTATASGDGTNLTLTCHWICHYAYENFRATTREDGSPNGTTVVNKSTVETSQPVSLGPDKTTGPVDIPAWTGTYTSSFDDVGDTSLIPGFTPTIKHIGIAALLDRIGKSTTISWSYLQETVQWDGTHVGNYVVDRRVDTTLHVGLMDAWNSKGQSTGGSAAHNVLYVLDDETVQDPQDVARFVGDGGA